MLADKDTTALKCFSALQLLEMNPVIWASLGCTFERREEAAGETIVRGRMRRREMVQRDSGGVVEVVRSGKERW